MKDSPGKLTAHFLRMTQSPGFSSRPKPCKNSSLMKRCFWSPHRRTAGLSLVLFVLLTLLRNQPIKVSSHVWVSLMSSRFGGSSNKIMADMFLLTASHMTVNILMTCGSVCERGSKSKESTLLQHTDNKLLQLCQELGNSPLLRTSTTNTKSHFGT